jgi:DNA-binding NarL/FixJ family response regulator
VIRILVVDDHPIVRDGLRAVLSTEPDLQVAGEAGDGAEALRRIEELHPDVLLLDLAMPQLDGVGVLQELRRRGIALPVIVFTAFDTDERIVDAVRAGARGYMLKGAPRNELFAAIRIVYSGGSLLQPIVATRLIEHIQGGRTSSSNSSADSSADTDGSRRPSTHAPMVEALSSRELEVLYLLAEGQTNRQIAERLFITERTVKFHVSAILAKLGAGNRTEAVALASQRGLLAT